MAQKTGQLNLKGSVFKESPNKPQGYDEVYRDAMALFALLRSSNTIRVRRADMKSGEITAEPIDFVCDIEMKAWRILDQDGAAYAEWRKVLSDPDSYDQLPMDVQLLLGFAFSVNRLGVDGDYRRLYWRVKQEQDRRAVTQSESEDDDAGIFGDGNGDSSFLFGSGEEGTAEAYT